MNVPLRVGSVLAIKVGIGILRNMNMIYALQSSFRTGSWLKEIRIYS